MDENTDDPLLITAAVEEVYVTTTETRSVFCVTAEIACMRGQSIFHLQFDFNECKHKKSQHYYKHLHIYYKM